jgi:hypothetical protein
MPKKAERQFPGLVKAVAHAVRGWYYWHKYGDVRKCPHCDGLLPKSDKMPDYVMALNPLYVEVKESNADGRWNITDIRFNQRNWLNNNPGALFIEIGTGKRPDERMAWLVPWKEWLKIEKTLLDRGQKSLTLKGSSRSVGAEEILSEWKLTWQNKDWIPQEDHPVWTYLKA